jgi:hypothetical protein
MCGYAVECGLKACICKTESSFLPAKSYTHNLPQTLATH